MATIAWLLKRQADLQRELATAKKRAQDQACIGRFLPTDISTGIPEQEVWLVEVELEDVQTKIAKKRAVTTVRGKR
jgi:hypothetical protein